MDWFDLVEVFIERVYAALCKPFAYPWVMIVVVECVINRGQLEEFKTLRD